MNHLVEFRVADGLAVDISVVTLYMFKWFNNQMRPFESCGPRFRYRRLEKPATIEYVNPAHDPSSELTELRTRFLWKIEPQAQAT